jgi:hypothetical protein
MGKRIELTAQRTAGATCPPDKASVDLFDAGQPGMLLRVYQTGRKVLMVTYRVGSGRGAKQRWYRLLALIEQQLRAES